MYRKVYKYIDEQMFLMYNITMIGKGMMIWLLYLT